MSGTPLNPARVTGLLATLAKALPIGHMTDDVAESWEKNGEELARRLDFLSVLAPAPKGKSKNKFVTCPDGAVTFTVKSDGTAGKGWITKLEAAGHKLSDYAKQVLRSSVFVPTMKGTIHHLTVLPGELWSSDYVRTTGNVRAQAEKRKLLVPHPEVACLIRLRFSNEDIKAMGLTWLVAMHESIKDADGNPDLLYAGARGGDSWLNAFWDDPDYQWHVQAGFVFASAQASAF